VPAVPYQQAAGTAQWASPAPGFYNPLVGSPTWDQRSLASAFSTMTVNPPSSGEWYFNSEASSHMASDAGILSRSTTRSSFPSSMIVGNGSLVPVISTGYTALPGSIQLHNVLVSPGLIKNIISVRQFTTDNNCSVEFDPSGCSVKDLSSRNEIIRCNSSGPLYPMRFPPATSFVVGTPQSLWHRRLGHPGHEALAKLAPHFSSSTQDISSTVCHACQLGRHVHLSLYQHLELLIILILFIVICGPPLLRVSLVTNIT
jgi:hypothetical protein